MRTPKLSDIKDDGSPEFDASHLPPLKPCPRCESKLEYWAEQFVVCTECEFDVTLPKTENTLPRSERSE